MNPQFEERSCLLRKSLMGNALFSTLSGLTILLAQGRVLRVLGLSKNIGLAILGVGLLVFAATLVINARRQQIKTADAWIAVLMDSAWVLSSCVLILVAPLSAGGKWVVGVVSDVVLVFAVLQFLGIRRIQKSEKFGSSTV
jgi:hypothetical protein